MYYQSPQPAVRPTYNNIHTRDVAVRGVVVGASLDVDTHLNILDRSVADNRLATAVDRYTFGHAAAIDNTTVEVVVTARRCDIVCRILTAQTYHCLRVRPPFGGTDNGVVR